MSINDVYTLMQYIINKNQQGYLAPAEFNRIINQAQTSYVSFLLGSFQKYQFGRPEAPVEFGENMTLRSRLKPVIHEVGLNIDATGFSAYPADYIQTDSMWSYYGYNRIREIEQDKMWLVYNSSIDPITTNPIYYLKDEGFQFFPTNLTTARMSYVANPRQMVWAYTIISGRPIYDAANSVQPVWGDTSMMDIISRALAMVGVNLQAPVIAQYANDIKNNGQ